MPNKIFENPSCFRILLTDLELHTTGILMNCKHWSAIRLSHSFVLLFDKIQICRLDRMWVPSVSSLNNEFSWNSVKEVVALMES